MGVNLKINSISLGQINPTDRTQSESPLFLGVKKRECSLCIRHGHDFSQIFKSPMSIHKGRGIPHNDSNQGQTDRKEHLSTSQRTKR